jgi:hypothetical protein
MTIWSYVGCKINDMPKNILDDPSKLSQHEIKQIIESVPIIEGKLEAVNEESVISLLLDDNIFPLKIHLYKSYETKINKLKMIRNVLNKKYSN